jgi:diguanylate cyclase (GGDEF)-like protein
VSTVLVVDDDPDIARFIELNLRLEGFEVHVVHDGSSALATAAELHPDLVVLDVMMPGTDGVEVCRRLRADPVTAATPVIMLTAKSMSADKVVGLTAGADDYVLKPFDTVELVARVRSTLRRHAEMRAVSPLTGLPGNLRIDERIATAVSSGRPFAVCHIDLDHFKAFNDSYGFLRGDDMIALLAGALSRAVAEAGDPSPFLGHIGGDDFAVVCTPEQAEPLARRAVEIFDAGSPALHDPEDVARGALEVPDRQGALRRFPLVSVSVGVVSSERRRFRDRREVVAVVSEMKAVAKSRPGSAVAVDRRSDSAQPTP